MRLGRTEVGGRFPFEEKCMWRTEDYGSGGTHDHRGAASDTVLCEHVRETF